MTNTKLQRFIYCRYCCRSWPAFMQNQRGERRDYSTIRDPRPASAAAVKTPPGSSIIIRPAKREMCTSTRSRCWTPCPKTICTTTHGQKFFLKLQSSQVASWPHEMSVLAATTLGYQSVVEMHELESGTESQSTHCSWTELPCLLGPFHYENAVRTDGRGRR